MRVIDRLFTFFIVAGLISSAAELKTFSSPFSDVNAMPSAQSAMMQMPQVAPFFLEDDATHNELTLVVNNPEACHVEVTISDLSGKAIAVFQQTVPAHGKSRSRWPINFGS